MSEKTEEIYKSIKKALEIHCNKSGEIKLQILELEERQNISKTKAITVPFNKLESIEIKTEEVNPIVIDTTKGFLTQYSFTY